MKNKMRIIINHEKVVFVVEDSGERCGSVDSAFIDDWIVNLMRGGSVQKLR
jgi:hypothetical protein